MARTNRHLLRFALLLVILMGLLGAWVADQQWQARMGQVEWEFSTEIDWIALVSDLAENGIRFFQGATTGQ